MAIGQRFGRLVIVAFAGIGAHRRATWECRCDCGKTIKVRGNSLATGNTKSCGCLQRERTSAAKKTHGASTTSAEYQIWKAMKARCFRTGNDNYARYGGRGITVCDRWRESFEAFLADMGLRPSTKHSIDRINNDGNYEPGNCRWATRAEQARNQRPRAAGRAPHVAADARA